jgi:hypothetical protein
MDGWFVKYLDRSTNRETGSLRVTTREEAIRLALDRKREGFLIRSIVGPDGEEPWDRGDDRQVAAKAPYRAFKHLRHPSPSPAQSSRRHRSSPNRPGC